MRPAIRAPTKKTLAEAAGQPVPGLALAALLPWALLGTVGATQIWRRPLLAALLELAAGASWLFVLDPPTLRFVGAAFVGRMSTD